MARASTRTRQAPKARRRGPARPVAGRRRRSGPDLSDLIVAAFRAESAALLVVLAALSSLPWLIPRPEAIEYRDALVAAVGLHVFTLALLLLGVALLVWRRELPLLARRPRETAAGLLLLVFSAGLLSLLSPDWTLAGERLSRVTAGGDAGAALTATTPALLAWLASGAAFAVLAWPGAVAEALRYLPRGAAVLWAWRLPHRAWCLALAGLDLAFPTRPPVDEKPSRASPAWLPPEPEPVERVEAEPPEEELPPPGPPRQAALPMGWTDPDVEEMPVRPSAAGWLLPPLDMLAGAAPADESARPDNAARAALIEETLASFGVDARVVQVNEGPVVTQFGIEPGWEVKYRDVAERDKEGRPLLDKDGKPKRRLEEVSRTRVRVNQVTALANDLALALAAPSLRVEAPVPGKSVIGIEVPNTAASVVTLRSVIETPVFQRLAARSKLALALGKGVSGEPVVADLTKMPHLLIAGATGSGKSVCINSIIACILMHSTPEEVRFVIIDPKRVELTSFSLIPHLAFSSIIVDVEKVVGTLGAVIHEMEARYKRFAAHAVRNIDAYNKHPRVTERLPYWVVIVDELADLMMAAPYEVERQICRLAQLARATGIHLIVATQRPSVDVVTGLIKANFPTRIAFAMSSQVDSRTILDTAGAERLLGRGDMLYMPTDAAKPKRVQGVFVSDQEIDRIVAFWAEQRAKPGHATLVYDHLLDEATAEIGDSEEDDPLFERARALALEHSRISTSLLQRRLRIGYPRAARLIDMLEEEGVVGSASAGGSREVLSSPLDDEF
jgi:S-DNA-T family DNA segregation ATPase FtsK/SpoIIIE